jgi:hypothetical protein
MKQQPSKKRVQNLKYQLADCVPFWYSIFEAELLGKKHLNYQSFSLQIKGAVKFMWMIKNSLTPPGCDVARAEECSAVVKS